MIDWALAAQCSLGMNDRLVSQLTSGSTRTHFVWNNQEPVDREGAIAAALRSFAVPESSRRESVTQWASIDAVSRSRASRRIGRVRRFDPNYPAESDATWEEMVNLGSEPASEGEPNKRD
jgi:hypothetical protein